MPTTPMDNNNNRKSELKRAYKETATRRGVYTITCQPTGQAWVDSARNVDTIRNRVWFNLGLGTHPNHELQSAWNEHGADAIVFDVVEVFDDELEGFALEDMLKERKRAWMEELGAASLL